MCIHDEKVIRLASLEHRINFNKVEDVSIRNSSQMKVEDLPIKMP